MCNDEDFYTIGADLSEILAISCVGLVARTEGNTTRQKTGRAYAPVAIIGGRSMETESVGGQ